MKIRTQFIITMILFGFILAVIAASAVVTSLRAEKTGEQEKIASSIAHGAGDLSYLTNDYLIYREGQQLKRWQTRFASLSILVSKLSVDKPEEQALVRNIQANQQRIKEVFESITSTVKRPAQNQGAALDLSFFQVSWSRMAVQSQGLVSDASRLSQLLLADMDHLRRMRTVLMYVMVGLFGLFLLVSYMLTYRRILKSIMTLQAGAVVIGSGNLDFKFEERKKDEIGDLSYAFNRMTANLKDVTASKSELEREIAERKQAEEELRQQREWLRVTLSSIGDAVVASDTKGRITFLNPVALTLTGWKSEEALGQPITSVFQIINEKTHQPAEDLVARVLSEKRVVALANDTAMVTRDGREIPIEDSAAPIKDGAGNLIGVVLVFHDVSEKRRAQATLRESEERLRLAQEAGKVGVWDWNLLTQELRWTQELESIYGLKPGSVRTYQDSITQVHPDDIKMVETKRDEAVVQQKTFEFEFRIQRPQGEIGWVYCRGGALYDSAGRPTRIFGVNIDVTERKRAEEALREAHERAIWLARFPEQNPNPVIRASADGTALYCNPVSSTLSGWKCEVGEVLQDELLPLVGRAMAEGREVQEDVQLDGRVYIVWISPFPGEGYANIYGRDITERKKAEEALRESEERFKAISTSTPDHLLVQDRELRYSLVINPQLGLTEQDMIGRTDYDILSKEDADNLTRIKRQVLETGNSVHVEMPLISLKGEQQFFDGSYIAKFNEKGQTDGLIGYFRNVTERKRMEEELRQSEEKSRLLIKYAPSMFYEIDFHRPGFKSVNDAMCQFLGYTREELLAMNPFDLLDDEGKAVFQERIRGKFAGEAISNSVEYKSRTKDGREVHGILNISFTYKDGKPEGAVVVAHDITERKKMEEELRHRTLELQQSTETLEQRVQERTEDLAKANETLRQLSSRLLSAQEEERKRIAGEIHDTLGSCLSAIKFKVESFSRSIGETPGVTAESLNAIIPVIQEGIEDCRRIQMDLRPSMLDDLGLLPTLAWFCRRFRTIYSGVRVEQEILIEESQIPNSLKIVIYRVTQEAMNNITKHSEADLVRLVLRKIDGRISAVVEDNGRGFDLEKVLRSESTSRGMGLTNMRERIELSGGSFEIQSTKGKGTTIRASWPL